MLASHLEYGRATLGGLALAVGMTTHAHKTGLLQETVTAYEVVLANGSLVRATTEQHAALFRALPWSHGTLGVLTALTLRIVVIKKYVRLDYIPLYGKENIATAIRKHCGAHSSAANEVAATFVEATLFTAEKAVLTVGDFTDGEDPVDKEAQVNHLARWYKPWWYKYVQQIADSLGMWSPKHVKCGDGTRRAGQGAARLRLALGRGATS